MVHMLWVDDDAYVLKGMLRPLEKDGWKITIAYDLMGATELIDKYKFDLILLDVILPIGKADYWNERPLEERIKLGGLEFVKKLNAVGNNTPIAVFSVVRSKNIINEFKLMGVKKYIFKDGSITPNILKAELDMLLSESL